MGNALSGGGGGGLGGLFGGLLGAAAQQQQQQAAAGQAAQANQFTPIAGAAPAPSGNPALGAQAGARKEHLTALFVSKGCKISDVQ